MSCNAFSYATRLACALSVMLPLGCASEMGDEPAEEVGSSEQAWQGLGCKASVPAIDVSRSLLVTDPAALARFGFKDVLDTIVARSNVPGQTSLDFYQRFWDTQNDSAHAVTSAPHCDDVMVDGAGAINDFPIQCPRQEGVLATTNPFSGGADAFEPVALSFRLDLAPTDGSACGEARIVYAKASGKTDMFDRTLIILEGSLPNPVPALGAYGCKPIAMFWANLSAQPSAEARADALESFYFNGLQSSGVKPVLRPESFGLTGPGLKVAYSGQIRTNQFMNNRAYFGGEPLDQPWQLRELVLDRVCTSSSPAGDVPASKGIPIPGLVTCRLQARMVSSDNNPEGLLWNPLSTHAKGQGFRQLFVSQVEDNLLAGGDVNLLSYSPGSVYDGGESTAQGTVNNYMAQLELGGLANAFEVAIEDKLTQLGKTGLLTSKNIADRATALSCAGCHQISNGKDLGGGMIWPKSLGFAHVNETSQLSEALANVFLPHRKLVLENYLNSVACNFPIWKPKGGTGKTLGGGHGKH